MNPQEQELARQIAQQVIAMLRQREQGAQAGPAAETGSSPKADIHPPAGICTGDYSKFQELRGQQLSTPPASPASASATSQTKPEADASAAATAPSPVVLRGIITAQQLQEAMDAAKDQPVLLAPDARLTPLAADLARLHPKRHRRQTASEAAGAGKSSASASAASAASWMWWIDGFCPVVRNVTHSLRDQLTPFGAGHSSASIATVLRELAQGIKASRAVGGLLFVPTAARAVVYANRMPQLRAIVGTSVDAVEQGIVELAANVLIVEYPRVKPETLAAVVKRFVAQPPRVLPALERELAQLQRPV